MIACPPTPLLSTCTSARPRPVPPTCRTSSGSTRRGWPSAASTSRATGRPLPRRARPARDPVRWPRRPGRARRLGPARDSGACRLGQGRDQPRGARRRAARADRRGGLEPGARQVHVVYGARDLGRQLPAVWQEGLKNRQTRGWGPFLKRSLLDDAAVDRGFWRSQHAVDVLARWADHVPADRITSSPCRRPTRCRQEETSLGPVLPGARDRRLRARPRRGADERLTQRCPVRGPPDAQPGVARRPELAGVRAHREATVQRRRQRRAVGAKDQDPSPAPRRGVRPGRAADRGAGTAGYRMVGDLDDLRPRETAFGRATARPAKVTRAAVQLLAAELEVTERPDSVGRRARTLMGRIQGRRQGSA